MIQICKTQKDLNSALQVDEPYVLIPTMGNLHQGHLALVRHATKLSSVVIVSIYVNPTQFGQNEDLDRYPRTLDTDLQQLEQLACELSIHLVVWAPTNAIMYPFGIEQSTRVSVPDLSARLCGANRPGHFEGVATIVSKLLHQVRPKWAILGEKDYQQLCIIQHLCKDMSLGVGIIAHPTQRDPDGLALSSRNQYLTSEQRKLAPLLYQTLTQLANQLKISKAPVDPHSLCKIHQKKLDQQGFVVEYLECCHAQYLTPIASLDEPWILLVAARLGDTRLIDNIQGFIANNA